MVDPQPSGVDLASPANGMVQGLLREVAERLADLAHGGDTSAIDLRSLPMTRADRDELEKRLGRGEVAATLKVAGVSEVWETGYAGVWWIRHFGGGDKVAAERIEITRIPDILVTDAADIVAAFDKLRDDLVGPQQSDASEETEHA